MKDRFKMSVIRVENLSKSYRDVKVFDSFSMKVSKGEKVAIVGKSGIGKSTLLKILGGLETNYTGLVSVYKYEQPQLGKTERNFYSNIVSFLLQDYGLVEEESILENVKIGNPNITEKDILPILKMFEMKKKVNANVSSLSGGEKQRVALIRVMLKNSKLVLCDEPTGNLDTETSKKIIDLILSLDQTVIIVTHDLEIAKKCDRVIDLNTFSLA